LRDNPRMLKPLAARRWLSPPAFGLLVMALGAGTSRAADLDVTAHESIVRSAPFDVAPEVARVHLGDRMPADDQPQGEWRRVQLPDGRRGFMRERDAKIVSPPPVPSAPAPGVAARAPAASDAAATALGAAGVAAPAPAASGPHKIPVKVTALELGVRATAAADAPIVKTLHQNDEVLAFPDLEDGWRRIEISGDQNGFVSDAGVKVVEAATPVAAPIATTPAAPAPAATEQAATDAISDLSLLGVLFEIMPTGTLKASEAGTSSPSSDTAFSVAVAPFFDLALSPYVALGFSPQFIFGVKGSMGTDSATEYDLRARLTGRYPLSPDARVYARFSPAYSRISIPSGDLPLGVSNPSGPVLDFAVGTEIAVLPKLFLVVDLGYQIGFQSTSDTNGTNVDFTTRYLHLGAGLAVGL